MMIHLIKAIIFCISFSLFISCSEVSTPGQDTLQYTDEGIDIIQSSDIIQHQDIIEPDTIPDAHSDTSEPLSIELFNITEGPIYPYDPIKGSNLLKMEFSFRLTNNSDREWQDLKILVPFPSVLAKPNQTYVEDGRYNGILKAFEWDIDWFPPEQGTIVKKASFEKDPRIFADSPESLKGELTIELQASLIQYDEVIQQSKKYYVEAFTPSQVSKQNFEYFNAIIDGEYIYVSGKPQSGEDQGKGGIYRVNLNDGGVERIAQHSNPSSLGYMAPFLIIDDFVYYVTKNQNYQDILKKIPKDGKGVETEVSIIPDINEICGLSSDESRVFMLIKRKTDPKNILLQADRSDFSKNITMTSTNIPDFLIDTISVTSNYVFIMQTNPNAILKIKKDSLEIEKVTDVGSTTGRRSLACNESFCLWTEWSEAGLYQIPISGGPKKRLSSTNQPIILDKNLIYSGINGIIRVGIDKNPPEERLFLDARPILLLTIDSNYLYFVFDSRIWKIHK